MNRRAFLASLGAAFALDPERALWTPGAKMISVPARGVELRRDIEWFTLANPTNDSDWLRRIYLMQAEVIEAAPRAPWVGIDIRWL